MNSDLKTQTFIRLRRRYAIMVHGLTKLLTVVMTSKRDLKRVYYTQRSEGSKLDAKELVASIIGVQRLIEELIDLKRKRRTAKKLPHLALSPDAPPLALHNGAGDGQPQSRADDVASQSRLDAEELLKQPIQVLRGDAHSLVSHTDDDFILVYFPPHDNQPPLQRVVTRVVQHVAHLVIPTT